MSLLWLLVGSSAAAVAAVGVVGSAFAQERPSLQRALADLREGGTSHRRLGSAGSIGIRPQAVAAERIVGRWPDLLDAAALALVGLTPERQVTRLIVAAVVGAVGPVVAVGVAQAIGLVSIGLTLTALVPLLGGCGAALLLHSRTSDRARQARMDLRLQLSSYLDVVTMLLAANTAHEGALEQAAQVGDGELFRELRRRQHEALASGRSLVDALSAAGRHLGLDELEQVAATAALAAAEGAPVARTLTAKCTTIRSTLATDQEAEARLRTSRLTGPLVGMALVFMALVIYPALHVP